MRKYLRMDEAAIALQQDNTERCKRLDDCRDYIILNRPGFSGDRFV